MEDYIEDLYSIHQEYIDSPHNLNVKICPINDDIHRYYFVLVSEIWGEYNIIPDTEDNFDATRPEVDPILTKYQFLLEKRLIRFSDIYHFTLSKISIYDIDSLVYQIYPVGYVPKPSLDIESNNQPQDDLPF